MNSISINFSFFVLFIITACISFAYYFIPIIGNNLMFHPYKATIEEYTNISKKYNMYDELVFFKSSDNVDLSGMLINSRKPQNWDDFIFLFSHGNGAWLGALFASSHIAYLSKYGSIFAYDYRQYGISNGVISEKGTYCDIMGAWNYLTNIKQINPKKIIIYGHSMGGAVSTYLVKKLVQNNKPLPLGLILEGTFSNIYDMGNVIFPGLGFLSTHKYNNIKNLKIINNVLPTLIIHSKYDEVVPYLQSLKIKKNCNCKHITINGTHSYPIFNKNVDDFIKNIIIDK